jgi:hypothetical protein
VDIDLSSKYFFVILIFLIFFSEVVSSKIKAGPPAAAPPPVPGQEGRPQLKQLFKEKRGTFTFQDGTKRDKKKSFFEFCFF